MTRLILIAIFFFCVFAPANAQVFVNENCTSAYQDIIALRFNDARQKLQLEKETNPQNLFVPYLENYIDFLTVFISEDEEEFDWLEENKSARINRIKKMSDSSRYKKYMLANIYLQWAVARLKFKEYFTAAVEINKAYRLISKNTGEFPDFTPNYISMGVLHIMIGMVPQKYHWLLDLISMEGSVEQGRDELNLVLEQSNQNDVYHYLKDETLFYLGFVDLNLNPDTAQLDLLLSELETQRKDNLLLSYLTLSILRRTGKNDEALLVFDSISDFEGYFAFHYLDYLQADCFLRKLETSKADEKFTDFLDNFKGRNYIKDAWRKKAWIALIEKDSSSYLEFMDWVKVSGADDVDIDKEALREAEKEGYPFPNTELVKTRLLFDGGYYPEAENMLQTMDTLDLNTEQKVERSYRLARIAHESGDFSFAKSYYLQTIENGSQLPRYYAGNSALKLGEFYESIGDFPKATFYYQLCLDLDFEEYENSIHSKAKAGLLRVKE